MSLFNADYPTFSDAAKIKVDKTEVWRGPLAELIKYKTTLMDDLPAEASTDILEDKGMFISGYERDKYSSLSDIDRGGKSGDFDTFSRTDKMGSREGYMEIRTKQAQIDPAVREYARMKEDKIREGMVLDAEHDLWYGNPALDARNCLGIAPRFSVLTDEDGIIKASADSHVTVPHAGEVARYITLDAGGGTVDKTSDAHLASAYFIAPGKNDCCLIYPKNVAGGANIEFNSYDRQLDTNEYGEKIEYSARRYTMWYGVALRNPRSVVRVANIDWTTEAGMKSFIDTLDLAAYAITKNNINPSVIYVPDKVGIYIRRYFADKVQPATYADAKPTAFNKDFTIGQFTFRPTFQLCMGETKITNTTGAHPELVM